MADELEILRKRTDSMNRVVENMETQHVVFYGPDGQEFHPDWCRECRVSVLLTLLWQLTTQQAARERHG